MGDYSELYLDTSVGEQEKLDMFTNRTEELFGIPQLTVVTCDDVGDKTKPDPLSVDMALDRLGLSAEQAAVMGDHNYDIQAGLKAGVETRIGITHGFGDVQELLDAKATHVVTSLSEASKLVAH